MKFHNRTDITGTYVESISQRVNANWDGQLGMAIPRRISLLEESRNGNSTFLGDRGRQNLILGVLGEFRGVIYDSPSPPLPL